MAAEIRRAIAEGEAGPGERLPLVKDLAAVLGVNKNTVLRAMHILRDEGLLDFTRGRGITVAGTAQRSAVLRQVREVVDFARRQGYPRDAVIDLIETLPSSASRAPRRKTHAMAFDPYAPYGPLVESTLRVVSWNVWGRYGEHWAERGSAPWRTSWRRPHQTSSAWSSRGGTTTSTSPRWWQEHASASPTTCLSAIGSRRIGSRAIGLSHAVAPGARSTTATAAGRHGPDWVSRFRVEIDGRAGAIQLFLRHARLPARRQRDDAQAQVRNSPSSCKERATSSPPVAVRRLQCRAGLR